MGMLITLMSPSEQMPTIELTSTAVSNVWQGGFGSWDIPSNWSLNHIPVSTEDVEINPGGFVSIPPAFAAEARTVSISSFGQLTIEVSGTLSLSENSFGNVRISNSGFLINEGSILIDSLEAGETGIKSASFFSSASNSGLIHIQYFEGTNTSGIENLTGTTFTNHASGEIVVEHATDINASSAITNVSTSNFINEGMIRLYDTRGGISNLTGAHFENSGIIEINRCNAVSGILNQTGAEFRNHLSGSIIMDSLNAVLSIEGIYNSAIFVNKGMIDIKKTSDEGIENRQPGATFKNDGSILLDQIGSANSIDNTASAHFYGSGLIFSSQQVQQDAFFGPGSSTGVVRIVGDLIHTSSAIDTFDVDGLNGGGNINGHDSVYIAGDLHLEGKLVVRNETFFAPFSGAQFVLFRYTGNLTGTFSSIELPAQFSGFDVDLNTPGYVILKNPNCIYDTNTWIGGDGMWTNPGGWSLGHVPTLCERVVIQGGDSVTVPAGIYSIQSLLLDGGILNFSSISIRFMIDVGFLPEVGFDVINGGRVHNGGSVSIRRTNGLGAYGMHVTDGLIFNEGSFSIQILSGNFAFGLFLDANTRWTNMTSGNITITQTEAPGMRIEPGAVLDNHGEVEVSFADNDGILNNGRLNNFSGGEIYVHQILNDGIVNLGMEVFNEGLITISDCELRGYANSISSTLTNNGTIDISNTASTNIFNGSSALVKGTGLFVLDQFISQQGKFSPGTSIGSLQFTGAFSQSATSVDTFEIASAAGGGISPGHDSVHVDGDLILAGALHIKLLNGFLPADTDRFILYAYTGSLINAFSSVALPAGMTDWFVDYTFPGRVELKKNVCDYNVNFWQGPAFGKWSNDANWSLGHAPLNCEEVIIATPDSVVILGGFEAEAFNVKIENGSILVIDPNGSLTVDPDYLARPGIELDSSKMYNNGTISVQNLYESFGIANKNEGRVLNSGQITIENYVFNNSGGISNTFSSHFVNEGLGSIHISNAGNDASSSIVNAAFSQFLNHGMIHVDHATTLSNLTFSIFTNGGSIELHDILAGDGLRNNSGAIFNNQSGGTILIQNIGLSNFLANGISNTGEMHNEGLITLGSTASYGLYNQGMDASFENNGTVEVSNSNVDYAFEASDLKNENGALLYGSGFFNGASGIRNEAFFTPGILVMQGNFVHTSESIDTFEIAGTEGGGEASGHDSVFVDGNLTLDGKLVISLRNGFIPADNDTFTIMQYTQTVSNSFSQEEYPYQMAGFAVDLSIQGKVRIFKKACTMAENEWIGGPGSWNDPTSWSLGHVPLYCENVLLGPGDTVTIPSAIIATALSLTNNGGQLTINELATLVIDVNQHDKRGFATGFSGTSINHGTIKIFATNGLNASGLDNSNSATFTNSPTGSIEIFDINGASAEGLINLATFTNEGMISVHDVSASHGIFHSINGHTFINSGVIEIKNVGSDGIVIMASALFQNSGRIDIQDVGQKAITMATFGYLDNSGTIEVKE